MLSHVFGSLLALALVPAALAAAPEPPAGTPRVHRDLPYAGPRDDDRGLRSLDVYAPASGTGQPVLIWIHGGGWTKGDKAHVGLKPRAFGGKGYVLVSVNYRLLPAVTVRDQAEDIARALAWVHRHAREYGGNPEQVFLMGHSAGAHLAALVATDDRYLKGAGLGLDAVKGVILLDGAAYDVGQRMRVTPPAMRKAAEAVFGTDEASWAAASPVQHVGRGKGIAPFLILHVADRDLSRAQSALLARTLEAAGVAARVVPAAGKTHGSLNQDLGKDQDEPTRVVFEFLEGLRGKPASSR